MQKITKIQAEGNIQCLLSQEAIISLTAQYFKTKRKNNSNKTHILKATTCKIFPLLQWPTSVLTGNIWKKHLIQRLTQIVSIYGTMDLSYFHFSVP